MNKKLKDKLLPIVDKLHPAARVAERIAHMAVRVQNPTVVSMTGLVAAGIAGLHDQLGTNKTPGWQVRPFVSKSQLLAAVEEAGARVVIRRYTDNSGDGADCTVHGTRFYVHKDGVISVDGGGGPAFLEWLRQALDRTLPAALEVRHHVIDRDGEYETRPASLSAHANAQAAKILADTLPLLEGGRTILLDGRPGVGKTTLAQIIGRDAGLGRTVMLAGGIVGTPLTGDGRNETSPRADVGSLRESLALLAAGVIIVDDIDKLYLPLSAIEALRAAAKLVVFTANNGSYDDVLDGATIRAGRIDEVFSIEPTELPRTAPFDRLTDEQWAEVSQWPIAYLMEVKKRLQHRERDLRLEDLRARLTKKTRSGEVLR